MSNKNTEKFTEEEIQKKYELFLKLISKFMSPERAEKMKHMYSQDELGPNLLISPASSKRDYHNCFEGGYIDHILNVTKNAMAMKNTWQTAGAEIDFTDEELIFVALNHDLGKLGEVGNPLYIPNPSQWHVENQGKIYIMNNEIPYMTHTDRTFWLLNNYGITFSKKEMLGIRLTDGLYDEDNKKYYITYNYDMAIKTPLYHIMHQADLMSSFVEQTTNK